jgi:Asp-tRNA(Asn)/Glu-tRNA(Gln) amidotransferase A subunit family amidase
MFREGANSHAPRQAANRKLLSAELNAAIDEGSGISEGQYRAAMENRSGLIKLAGDLLSDCDALASPPAPGAAPRRLDMTGDPSFCTLWSLLGFPAITLPCALSAAGLPFGIQLAAHFGDDTHLLRVARWCENRIGFDRPTA